MFYKRNRFVLSFWDLRSLHVISVHASATVLVSQYGKSFPLLKL